MAWNRFGLVYTDLPPLYPGTVTADYGSTGADPGQTEIEEAIDAAVDQVIACLPADSFAQMTDPDLALVVKRATDGQTTFTLPLIPVVDGSVHLWAGQPCAFTDRPQTSASCRPTPVAEIDADDFTVTNATGEIVLGASVALSEDDVVYGSWTVDVEDSNYAVADLGRYALRGAAAELGHRLYTESQQVWKLVEKYDEIFQAALDDYKNGLRVPDLIRRMKWWEEVERQQEGLVQSIKTYRG